MVAQLDDRTRLHEVRFRQCGRRTRRPRSAQGASTQPLPCRVRSVVEGRAGGGVVVTNLTRVGKVAADRGLATTLWVCREASTTRSTDLEPCRGCAWWAV